MTSFAVQQGRAPLSQRGDDLYESPIEAVRALIKTGELKGRLWEPACGRGAIVRPLREAGFEVMASDLVDRGFQPSESGIDFLMENRALGDAKTIVTNPPFKLADSFVRHSLRLAPTGIFLLRWAYAEGANRSDLIDRHLSRVWLGRERLPFMHRDGYEGPRNSNSGAPFAWFVFEREPKSPGVFEVRRMSWRG